MPQPNQYHSPVDVRVAQDRVRRFLRLKDCASELGCSVGHVRNVIKSGKIEAFELDGLVLIAAAAWDQYLDSARAKK